MTFQLTWELVIMMAKTISIIAMVPVMIIAGLLLKPGLVTKGVFITAIVVEFFMAFMASDYYDNH